MPLPVDEVAASISEALQRGEPVRALRAAMARAASTIGRLELIAAFRIATGASLADASVIGAWHVFGERLSDDALDAELTARLRARSR